MRGTRNLAFVFLLWAAAASAQEMALAERAKLFAYDAKQPLDVQSKVAFERDGVTVYDVTYASPKSGRVPAYLVVPAGRGPFAGILFGHWGQGDRTEFLPEAILYAKAGAVSLLPAYPWVRPAAWRKNLRGSEAPENDFEAYVQAVVDLRRGLDLLLSRPDVDAKRIGYVGHSFGAQWGAILTAIDRRMRAAVLVGGVPDADAIYAESDDPELVELRAKQPERVKKHLAVMRPLGAVGYVPHSKPIPVFFQFAQFEQFFGEPAMKRYFAAASEPKSVKWYPTGHDLNDPQALADRAEWLREQIGIRGIAWPK